MLFMAWKVQVTPPIITTRTTEATNIREKRIMTMITMRI